MSGTIHPRLCLTATGIVAVATGIVKPSNICLSECTPDVLQVVYSACTYCIQSVPIILSKEFVLYISSFLASIHTMWSFYLFCALSSAALQSKISLGNLISSVITSGQSYCPSPPMSVSIIVGIALSLFNNFSFHLFVIFPLFF